MATQVQWRGGSTAEHATFTGAAREVTVDTQKKTLVVHDGSTAGGVPLLRENQSNLPTTAPTTGIYNASGSLAISTNGAGRLFVDAGGTLKVGTSADPTFGTFPRPAFYIKQLSDPNSSWGGIHIEAFGEQSVLGIGYDGNLQAFSLEASYRSTGGFRPIVFKTSSTERLRITSAGLVGVGTSAPSTTLSVAGGISGTAGANISGAGWGVLPYVANSLVIDNNAGEARFFATGANATTRGSFIFYNGETDGGAGAAMVIDSSGRLGVGTTSPARPLDVNGSVRLSSGSVIEFGGTVTNFITGDNSSNYLAFGTNSSERARIDSSGRLLVGTSTPVAAGAKLQTVDGITFPTVQVASTDPNTLDDYEEGTWTPNLTGVGGGAYTYGFRTGIYTKVGNIVTVHCAFEITGTTTAYSGSLIVDGLPYICRDVRAVGSVSPGAAIAYSAPYTYAFCQMELNQSFFYVSGGNLTSSTQTGAIVSNGIMYGFSLVYKTS